MSATHTQLAREVAWGVCSLAATVLQLSIFGCPGSREGNGVN